jgi:hypothetical protein
MTDTNIRERRAARRSKNIKSNDELYEDAVVKQDIQVEETPYIPPVQEQIATNKVKRNHKKPLSMVDYDYQHMAVEYSKPNTPQQLGNYRTVMDFLAHVSLVHNDDIVDRLKSIIYDYPNVDISSFANKENALLYTWITKQMSHTLGEKYLGAVYVLGGGMGLLGAMLLDTKLRFETLRSFDINGVGQFLADELMKKELLSDWRFKATTQDLFEIDYAKHTFITRLQDGSLSDPFKEIPGTIINTNISYLKNHKDWYNMIPDLRRVVVVGETGDVPYPFTSSQQFNQRFPMNFELYTGVINIGEKQFFMKIGHK